MITRRFATKRELSLAAALALAVFGPSLALAQDHSASTAMSHELRQTPKDAERMNALAQIVRAATERFRDPAAAEAEGYGLMLGCVSGGDFGAMGLRFVNSALAGDDVMDPARPEIVIYEPACDGRMRLIGADFLVFKDVWDAAHPAPPQLMGQLFHLFDAPKRFGLPAFYTLHVWAWKHNSNGTFVNWNPYISCDAFTSANGQPPDPGADVSTRLLSKRSSPRIDGLAAVPHEGAQEPEVPSSV
jgi:hypothetical protein